MGILRLLLALSVVYAHLRLIESPIFIQAGLAVIVFYMISGFYMSMIITEKYAPQGKGWEWRFFISRALRIFPAYWAVLIFSISFQYLTSQPDVFTNGLGLTELQRWMAIVSNIIIFGQDWIIAGASLRWNGAHVGLTTSWQQFPVLTAWTIAVELTFYIFAAFFLVRGKRLAIFALCLAVYFRAYFIFVNGKALGFTEFGLGLSNDPWGYHFFGTVLIFFMLGYLGYQLYAKLSARIKKTPELTKWVGAVTAALISAIAVECFYFNSFRDMWGYNDAELWMAVPIFALLIPGLFIVSKKSKIDNYLGLYCYPVYLCHVIGYDIGDKIFSKSPHAKILEFMTIMVISALIVHLIEIPMDRVRKRTGSADSKNRKIHFHANPTQPSSARVAE